MKKKNIRSPELEALNNALIEKFGIEEFTLAKERAKFKIKFAHAVKQRRVEMKMDQKELAKKLHTSQQQLSRYEVGENGPTIERLYDLCVTLGLELIIRDKENGRELVKTTDQYDTQ